MSTVLNQHREQRWLSQSPDGSESSFASFTAYSTSSSRRSPITPTTTPVSTPGVVDHEAEGSPVSLDAFLAEVDEWLMRTHQSMAELERRHRRHVSAEGAAVGTEWQWDGEGQARQQRVGDKERE